VRNPDTEYYNLQKSYLTRFSKFLAIAALCIPQGLMAAVCTGSPPSIAPLAPQHQFVRAYRHDFGSPLRLAIDAAGSVYVADPKRGEVVVRAADGRVIQQRSGLGRPGAIAVDAANQVYLADLDTGLISVYDSQWQLSHQFGSAEIVSPAGISIDNAGNRVYVSDSESHRVVVFSTAGEHLFDFGTRGNGDAQLLYPSGVFFDVLRNEVLVSDQLGYRVQSFSASGEWLYCFGGTSASAGGFFQRGRLLSAPQGLWADGEGRVYVADSFEGEVKVLDRSGRLLTTIGSFGSAAGELRIPSDVVVDQFGRLFVANANNARLEVFGIDAFSDPEQVAPALLDIQPAKLRADENGTIKIQFKTPGYHLSEIQNDSIRANGVRPLSVASGDFDGDARPEHQVLFDQQAVLRTLTASGPGRIVLTGALAVLAFEGEAEVEVMAAALADLDLDGVLDDVDNCPATMPGDIVDTSGCALQQYCSCKVEDDHSYYRENGYTTDENKKHKYRKCIARSAKRFQRAGLIDKKQRKQVVRDARLMDCGKPHRQGKHWKHEDDDSDGEDHDDKNRHRKQHDRSMQKGTK
jgi:DNA-binding beta-propeller fold protein YncE